jgi:hypothetical protein
MAIEIHRNRPGSRRRELLQQLFLRRPDYRRSVADLISAQNHSLADIFWPLGITTTVNDIAIGRRLTLSSVRRIRVIAKAEFSVKSLRFRRGWPGNGLTPHMRK